MLFNTFKNRRRARILATSITRAGWNQLIRDNCVHDQHLTSEQQKKLRRLILIFVAEKELGRLRRADDDR